MKKIKENPFRVVGILAGATARELQKQKSKISAYSKANKEITSDYDFSILGAMPTRSEDAINKAFSEIEQNQDKVHNALFWFVNATSFDNTAIEYLKKGNDEKAFEIWEKVTQRSVGENNFSAFNNLGSIYLLRGFKSEIQKGIELKLRLINSDYFVNFVHIVADETFTIDTQKEMEKFVDTILEGYKFSTDTFLEFFNGDTQAQNYLSKKFTETPTHNIEREIDKAKKARKDNKATAYQTGIKLHSNTKDDLATLKSLLGVNDLTYKRLADNVAKEILQCGIDYFKYWKDSKDISKETLNLLKYSKLIATNQLTVNRIEDNIKNIEDWASTAKINKEIKSITSELKMFQNRIDTIENAEALIDSCMQPLRKIRLELGIYDDFYLKISSAVANNAMGMLVEAINGMQSEHDTLAVYELITALPKAVSLLDKIGSLDMLPDTRNRYNRDKAALSNIKSQIDSFSQRISSSHSSSSSGGCYIATMAYGDYDHPQVIELRKFRDHFLSKTVIGRLFIKFYYKYSPSLVEKLKDHKIINTIIKKCLDLFIKIIK